MEKIKEALLLQIREIENSKKESHCEPTHVTLKEIKIAVRQALNELYHEGKINVGDTINDKYISTIINGNNV